MKLSASINPIQTFIESFLVLFSFMRIFSINTNHFLSLIIFLCSFVLLAQLHQLEQRRMLERSDRISACILSFLFTLFTISAQYQTLFGDLTNKLFCMAILILSTFGFLIIYYHFTLFILLALQAINITNGLYKFQPLPIITFFVCLLGWLPYLLYNFPGVMTPDSINQYAQIIGVYAQSNHHPWMHTQLIHILYSIGMASTQNPILAISFYTIFQMCFLAFVAAYTVRTLQKLKVITPICVVVTCFYALMPYHGALSVTIWKDVMFAGAFTLFSCTLLRFLILKDNQLKPFKRTSQYVLYFIASLMVCLFRTNGWYVFLVSLPFIIFMLKNNRKKIICANLGIIILVLLIKIPIMNIYDVTQPDFAESLSIPAQQIARVYAVGAPVAASQQEALNQIIDTSQIASAYQADVYDPVKYLLRKGNQTYLENHKLQYLNLWLSIGLQHPQEYFDAYVAQTKGYWYPDVSCQIGLDEGIYENEFGLTWSPIIKGSIIIKIKEIIFKLWNMIPLYGLLWSMGAIFWFVLLGMALTIKNDNASNILIFIPPVLLVMTLCLATPVAAEFRYAYSLFFTLPLYVAAPFIRNQY